MARLFKRKKGIKIRLNRKGFSLFEVVLGIALIALVVLGLAQMFVLSVLNNMRSDRITSATFLAQEQVDLIRGLTLDEMSRLASSTSLDLNNDGTPDIFRDEQIDMNSDTTIDYRRVTQVVDLGGLWEVRVFVFSNEVLMESQNDLIATPARFDVKAVMSTIIWR